MSDTTMTPDQFFDQLDKIFGCDDGYINHLQRIKDLKDEEEEDEEYSKQEGREEKEKEYEELAFEIGGKFQPNHPDLMKDMVMLMKSEIKKLKDFTNWENHPALKHKVVLDDDYYLQHLNEEGELIHPHEVNEIKEEIKKLKEELMNIKTTD